MNHILDALAQNIAPAYLLTLLIGSFAGTIIGALPGLSAVSGVALMLPLTFSMEPAQGLIMLAAVYASAEMGGAIPAILMATPGTGGAAVTTLDGFPMARQGLAREALYVQLLAGCVGGVVGGIVLLFFTPVLARWSLLLGPMEYFWLGVSGLALVALLSGANIVKGLIAVTIGVLMTIPGQDAMTGAMRFTFGNHEMVSGIGQVPALLGLFAVANILKLVESPGGSIAQLERRKGVLRKVLRRMSKMKAQLTRASILGTLIGIVPGPGASMSAFVAYAEAKRKSKEPEKFGKGAWEGVAAPEAANNAMVPGAMVPLLGLGIPGTGSAAILYSALAVHGIFAGPQLFTERADIAYTFMVGLLFTVPAMLLVGLFLVRYTSLVVRVPVRYLVPSVLVMAMIGTYAYRSSLFDVMLMIVIGIIAYVLDKVGISPIAIALGLVLGQLVEQGYQRAHMVGTVAEGSLWNYMMTRPIAIAFAVVSMLVLAAGVRQIIKGRREGSTESVEGRLEEHFEDVAKR